MQICRKIWVIMEMLYDRKSKICRISVVKVVVTIEFGKDWNQQKVFFSFLKSLFYPWAFWDNFPETAYWYEYSLWLIMLIQNMNLKLKKTPNNRFWVNNQDLMIISAYQHIKNIFRDESNFHFIKNISRHQPCPDQWEEEHEVKFIKTCQLLTKWLLT